MRTLEFFTVNRELAVVNLDAFIGVKSGAEFSDKQLFNFEFGSSVYVVNITTAFTILANLKGAENPLSPFSESEIESYFFRLKRCGNKGEPVVLKKEDKGWSLRKAILKETDDDMEFESFGDVLYYMDDVLKELTVTWYNISPLNLWDID